MSSTMRLTASGVIKRPRLHWRRGFCVAAVISVLVHGCTLNVINQNFDFKFTERSGSASLNTRVIQAASEQAARVQSAEVLQPVQAIQALPPRPKLPPPVAERQPSPAPTEMIARAAPLPDSTLRAEPVDAQRNQPLPGTESTLFATETIATPIPNPTPPPSASMAAGQGSAAAQPSMAVRLQYPPNARLEFDVLRVQRSQSAAGSGFLNWKSDGGAYELQMESSVLGVAIFTQQSVGALDTMGLAPERFSDKRSNRSEQATHFRRALGVVQFSNNKPETSLLPGMQDRLSVLLQLAGIIGGDLKRYEIVNQIALPVAGLDVAEIWEFSIEKPLDITVPAANMRAIKLVRKPRHEFDQQLELWLSPQLGYLPIRIRQIDAQDADTNFMEMSLRRLP